MVMQMDAADTAAPADPPVSETTSSHDDSKDDGPGVIARTTSALIRWALSLRIVRAALLYTERRGPVLADAVTYRALFSVFAGVLLGFSVAALWLAGNDQAWDAVVRAVDSAVPGLVGEDGIVDPEAIDAPAGLSIAGLVSAAGLIGAALGAIGSLRTAMRTIAGTLAADLAWYWVILRNVLLALVIAVSFLGSAALTFAGGVIVRWLAGAIGVAEDSSAVFWSVRGVSIVVVLALNAALIAASFLVLSGVRASARSLWTGAAIGAVGLLVLQELSGLFVGGATSNPLLTSFASLLALLIWINLSTQVILIAGAYITTAAAEEHDRVRAKYGAETFAQRAVRRAEEDVHNAQRVLREAREAERG